MCKVFDKSSHDQPQGNGTKETCDAKKKVQWKLGETQARLQCFDQRFLQLNNTIYPIMLLDEHNKKQKLIQGQIVRI